LKTATCSYEVAGRSADELTSEINRILEGVHAMMQNVQVAATQQHVRVQFQLEGTRQEQGEILRGLKQSSVFERATALGPVHSE
jgi:hypothetical protein